jgi:hypothetical protein
MESPENLVPTAPVLPPVPGTRKDGLLTDPNSLAGYVEADEALRKAEKARLAGQQAVEDSVLPEWMPRPETLVGSGLPNLAEKAESERLKREGLPKGPGDISN